MVNLIQIYSIVFHLPRIVEGELSSMNALTSVTKGVNRLNKSKFTKCAVDPRRLHTAGQIDAMTNEAGER